MKGWEYHALRHFFSIFCIYFGCSSNTVQYQYNLHEVDVPLSPILLTSAGRILSTLAAAAVLLLLALILERDPVVCYDAHCPRKVHHIDQLSLNSISAQIQAEWAYTLVVC